MKISGLEKLTLTDFPGHIACIVFTQGCNFRCPFCQNSTLLPNEDGLLSEDYVMDYLEKRKNVLEGVVITGGEPTIQKDLKEFIKKIKQKGLKVKLDTNGSNPKVVKELLDDNLLDYVAMDIKNAFSDYDKITGVKAKIDNIKESIKLLKSSKIDYEFRTTIVKEFHDIDKIKEIAKVVDGSKYFLQNFQDSEYVLDRKLSSFTDQELREIQEKLKDFPNVRVRGL